jgi:hypothetical protein
MSNGVRRFGLCCVAGERPKTATNKPIGADVIGWVGTGAKEFKYLQSKRIVLWPFRHKNAGEM